jgi:predicted DNA-binding transcriptional regulator AlpA
MATMLRINEVIKKVGFSKSMIYKLINEEKFFKPYKYRGCSFWDEELVDLWIKSNLIGHLDGEE